jgi:hypothetical protein
MVVANRTLDATSDTAMFLRLWDGAKLTPTLARQLLKLGWSREDESRMRELTERNRESRLDEAESRELDNYLRVGMTVSILQSRARKALKGTPSGNAI